MTTIEKEVSRFIDGIAVLAPYTRVTKEAKRKLAKLIEAREAALSQQYKREIIKAKIEAAKRIDGMLPAEEPTIIASRRTEDEDNTWTKSQMSFAEWLSESIGSYQWELEAELQQLEELSS